MRIVFMGTPVFALKTLEGILNSGEEVVLVVTQPDKPKGRGLISTPSPVKNLALLKNIPVITPQRLKSEDLVSKIQSFSPDLIVVAAYGKIIPGSILDIPKLFPINVHASLLPKYRGAAPINWAIIRGEIKTGITIMKMNEKMDAGDIMMREEIPIEPEDDASSLHDKLALLGGDTIQRALKIIKSGKASFTAQNEDEITFAPMLRKQDGLINWEMNNTDIENFIRGMNPWPGAYSFLRGSMIKIYRSEKTDSALSKDPSKPGEIVGLFKDSIMVKTAKGFILIKELQMASRKRLKAQDFLKGYGDIEGLSFESG